jgi:hypothetical protein
MWMLSCRFNIFTIKITINNQWFAGALGASYSGGDTLRGQGTHTGCANWGCDTSLGANPGEPCSGHLNFDWLPTLVDPRNSVIVRHKNGQVEDLG